MNLFSLFYGYFLINAFKSFGYKHNIEDDYLTYIGSVGAIMNCVFRLVWAWLVDHFNFNKIYAALLILQFIATSLICVDPSNKNMFFLIYVVSSVCYGGHFSIAPAICA
jgi:MFS family permease